MKSDVKSLAKSVYLREACTRGPRDDARAEHLAAQVGIIIDLAQQLGIIMSGQLRPALLRVPEVAEMLSLSPKTVYELLSNGDIPGVRRIGRCVRVARDPLLRWIREGENSV